MDRAAADQALTDAKLVPCVEGLATQAQTLERDLLDADIPARLVPVPKKECCGSGGCGCGLKMQVLIRDGDATKVAQLFRNEWLEAVEREGLHPLQVKSEVTEGDLPCPACGTAAPLVEGACTDCGLQLE